MCRVGGTRNERVYMKCSYANDVFLFFSLNNLTRFVASVVALIFVVQLPLLGPFQVTYVEQLIKYFKAVLIKG